MVGQGPPYDALKSSVVSAASRAGIADTSLCGTSSALSNQPSKKQIPRFARDDMGGVRRAADVGHALSDGISGGAEAGPSLRSG